MDEQVFYGQHVKRFADLNSEADRTTVIENDYGDVKRVDHGMARGHIRLNDKLNIATVAQYFREIDKGATRQRAMTAGGALNGAELVPRLRLLTYRQAIYELGLLGKLGINSFGYDFAANNRIPTLGKASSKWLAEDEAIIPEYIATGARDFTGKTIGVGVGLSRLLYKQIGENVDTGEGPIQMAIVLAVQEAITKALVAGTGENNQPTGLANTAGIPIENNGDAGNTTHAETLTSALETLEKTGVDKMAMRLLVSPDARRSLTLSSHASGTSLDVLQLPQSAIVASQFMPARTAILGDFSSVDVPGDDSIMIKMKRVGGADKRQLFAFHDADIVVSDPAALVKITNI